MRMKAAFAIRSLHVSKKAMNYNPQEHTSED